MRHAFRAYALIDILRATSIRERSLNEKTDADRDGQPAQFPTNFSSGGLIDNRRPVRARADVAYAVAQLRRADLRVTRARVTILRFFIDMQHGHYSAEEVHREVGRRARAVHLSSVYRVLTLLCDARLLSSVTLEPTRVVYELNDGSTHDHLVCDACGRVYDFTDPTFEARRNAIAGEHRFRVDHYQLVMHGVCHACQEH
jgi:Fur family transcriptional regulator, ferric uptake regulator